jgi:class 3 adenylate cyclase
MSVTTLFAEWHGRGPASPLSLIEYRKLGKAANEKGESLLAFDVAREGLKAEPQDKELKQIKALALARMGSTKQARELLMEIRDQGHDDEETLGLLSRTYKDLWLKSGSSQDLANAFNEYLKAYNHAPERYWTGINAATLAFAMKDSVTSSSLAQKVLDSCKKFEDAAPAPDYWRTATKAEASLLLGDIASAERDYSEARKIGSLGNVLATWRNAQIILRLQPQAIRVRIEQAFRPPKAAIFEGAWAGACGPLAGNLQEKGASVSYSSAAAGEDIQFLEAMQSIGGQTHIVLPFNEEQFVKERVSNGGAGWEDRYRKVRALADDITVCSDQPLKFGNTGDEYALDVMRGLAKIHAGQLGTELLAIGDRVSKSIGSSSIPGFGTERRAMIFADAFQFSKLNEEQMPLFISEVMDRIAALSRNADPQPEYQNTWGDGLFFVFQDVVDAGQFALDMAASIAGVDRSANRLPADLALRISLHAGPVYKFADQIAGKDNYIGSHVNRTARIEPITPAGKIWATDAFAALATLQAPRRFRFDYMGRIPLAKGFGEFPIYELNPR